MADDLASRIRSWLGEQGYPLELRVAHAFQSAGFEVSSSEYYNDPDEGKPREIDVIASMSAFVCGISIQIAFMIECKSSKKKPWVLFCSQSSPMREPRVGYLAPKGQ